MTVVADASVLIATLVDSGREGRWAETEISGDDAAGPELALAEASSALRRLERTGEISPFEATTAYDHLLRFDIVLFPFAPFAARIWALRNNLTCYDAWYVALAEALGCPLVTLDGRLARAAGPECRIVVPPWLDLGRTQDPAQR